MQALWNSAAGTFWVVEPFLAGLILIALLVYVGDRGSKTALKRNSPCLAALCVFAFALGTGLAIWSLIMNPISTLLYDAALTPSYPLITMYWAFWLLVGVLISAKKLVYENAKRSSQYLK